MRYVTAAGLHASVIGLGTWQFGSREWGYGEEYATITAPAIVARAVELGISFFDTAEIYGFGRSERILGAALAAAGNGARNGHLERAVIATKLFPLLPIPALAARSARASRERLGLSEGDAIDLYQLHGPNPIVPVSTTMRGLRDLLDQGVIRHAGVSNYSLAAWRRAERALGRPLVSNQVRFSLASPSPAWELVPWAAANDRLVIAYSPLGQGLLAHAEDDRQRDAPGAARFGNPLAKPAGRGRARQLLGLVREIAEARGATPAQVALAWVISHPNVIAIPGARNPAQLAENAAAADLALTTDEVTALTREADRADAARRA